MAAGRESGTVMCGQQELVWRPANLLPIKFLLQTRDGGQLFLCTRKFSIGINAEVVITEAGRNHEKLPELLLLSWFAYVNQNSQGTALS